MNGYIACRQGATKKKCTMAFFLKCKEADLKNGVEIPERENACLLKK
nr:hypothetical protein [Clostridium sp. DL-VIII]